ncbi:MAG: hypothetical protein AAF202_06285, partial [Pseudomonadota bacterium]
MKANRSHILFFVTGSMLTVFMVFGQSCGEVLQPSSSDDSVTKSESNGDYYTGIQDELSKSASSYSESIYEQGVVQNPFNPGSQVDSSSCPRSIDSTCSSGVRRLDYNTCTIGSSRSTLTGYRQLTYNQTTCRYSEDGDELQDQYDVTKTNRFNQEFLKSTEPHFDYRGFNIGGGIVYQRTRNGFQTEVFGKRAQLTWPGLGNVFDFSRRTLVPTVFERIAADEVRITQSSLEVNDNLNR